MRTDIKALYQIFKKHPVISTDSRKIEPRSLFFALKGDNFDGNRFAFEALEKGAGYAIADDEGLKPNDRILLVDNVLKALQRLAQMHRQQLQIPVIGITGSNGKTTTKELLHMVLKSKYKTFATTGNLNNHIGVPLSLLSIDNDHQIAVIEMGANHMGDIAELCEIARPEFGMITNIGKAHLEGFGGEEGVVKAKTELYKFIQQVQGKVFVNADDQLLMEKSSGMNRVYYGHHPGANVSGSIIHKFPFLEVGLDFDGEISRVKSKMVGSYNLNNLLAAACVGRFFEIATHDIANALAAYTPANHRSQWLETKSNKLIMDAYNANPSSMKLAIENFAGAPYENKMLVLGDMLELGEASEREHKKMIDYISTQDFKKVILVGDMFYRLASELSFIDAYQNVLDVVQDFKSTSLENFTILVKGSRGIQLEKLLEVL